MYGLFDQRTPNNAVICVFLLEKPSIFSSHRVTVSLPFLGVASLTLSAGFFTFLTLVLFPSLSFAAFFGVFFGVFFRVFLGEAAFFSLTVNLILPIVPLGATRTWKKDKIQTIYFDRRRKKCKW